MIEVLWHGRGGQGAFTAARLLGAASSLADGRYALAFPSFGPERRGAPMRAFTKMSDEPIGDRSAVAQADFVVYLDDTLIGDDWASELKPGGKVLANSTRTFDDERIVALDADGISTAVLGRPIPNTVFLGAIAALSDRVSVEDVHEAIRQYMPEKLHAKNISIVNSAVLQTAELVGAAAFRGTQSLPADEGSRTEVRHAFASEAISGTMETLADVGGPATSRPDAHIPTLRTPTLDPADYARSTCFEAGHLVAKNAGWRNIRPVVDQAACTGCLQCYMYCPDGTVYKVEGDAGKTLVAIDYDFCKGCGICVTLCKFDALAMIPESEALAAEAAAACESEADAR